MNDVGLTHVALQAKNVDKSIDFYARYAAMKVVHQRVDSSSGARVVWLSDRTRPFVIVLAESAKVNAVLSPFAHLGIGCQSRDDVDRLCEEARREGILIEGPHDSGYPVGYWAFLRDPDGHTLEVSYGQEIGLTVEEGRPTDVDRGA